MKFNQSHCAKISKVPLVFVGIFQFTLKMFESIFSGPEKHVAGLAH